MFLALNRMETPVRRYLRAFAKSKMTTPWISQIQSQATTKVERRVIGSTATLAVSDQNVRVQAAAKGRPLRGGLNPKADYAAVEFGANRNKRITYRRKGNSVTRHTARQLRPRKAEGYVFYPAAEKMIPRLASLWVQTIVKGVANVFDGKDF